MGFLYLSEKAFRSGPAHNQNGRFSHLGERCDLDAAPFTRFSFSFFHTTLSLLSLLDFLFQFDLGKVLHQSRILVSRVAVVYIPHSSRKARAPHL